MVMVTAFIDAPSTRYFLAQAQIRLLIFYFLFLFSTSNWRMHYSQNAGFLCGVGIAMIIFAEKPGQQEKLYEDLSTDVQDIVKSH
ncbi:hypothetical protein GYMLUDRAFT_246149 [Collybiopsis luxurians FD-317 M1]|uniref:Uncharacterized protein n=1 Tax=Collybiopsis luxurians FD-317 M1 TaxID=944289 RepID=A0A0D0C7L3_9AGAR|nr:hypothetical protein GYMLUDRAFT_246149 [Collybiopsis luxurians FD-317 M1]